VSNLDLPVDAPELGQARGEIGDDAVHTMSNQAARRRLPVEAPHDHPEPRRVRSADKSFGSKGPEREQGLGPYPPRPQLGEQGTCEINSENDLWVQ